MSLCLLVLLLGAGLLFPASNSFAEDPPVVAVFLMESRGSPLKADEVVSLTDYLSTRLGEQGRMQIIPRDELRKRIKATKTESHKECFDSSCQIELGRELAAKYSISSKIGRVGKSCIITAQVWDLRKATQIMGETEIARCDPDKLIVAVDKIAAKLKLAITGDGSQKSLNFQSPEPDPVIEPAPKVVIGHTHSLRSKHLALAKNIYGKDEAIQVDYFKTTGSNDDWICVVPAGSKDDYAGGRYDYLTGKEGKYAVSGLGNGKWEARLYLDYSNKGYVVTDRLAFQVGAPAAPKATVVGKRRPAARGGALRSKHMALAQKVYNRKDQVVVNYFNTTGSDSDWICVVPASTRDDNAGDRYDYLTGKEGKYSVTDLPKGDWEARLYLDYNTKGYVVTDRIRFSVR